MYVRLALSPDVRFTSRTSENKHQLKSWKHCRCSILPGSDGTYPCTKAALFWEASQSLAQFASAQRCQAGPLLHEQVGKEEVCDGQLAYEQIQHLI